MYRAFKTKSLSFKRTSDDRTQYESHANNVKRALSLASANGKLDGTELRDTWFPQQIDAQVFISHSHKDVNTAIQLSNWLHSELGIKAFIDSAVWLYADDLLREIDNKYCFKESSQTYSYEKRNGTTAHVHMMLATAISLMLDSCECALFLDTPNSVSREDAIEQTESPWLMYELNLMSVIRPKPPSRQILFSEGVLNDKQIRAKASANIAYDLDLSQLTHLSAENISSWRDECEGRAGTRALDKLYEMY